MRVDAITLLDAVPAKRATLLIDSVEDQWFERKSLRVSADMLARALIGFANAEGGLVAIGVSDGVFESTDQHQKHFNSLRRTPQTHCAPPPHVRFHEINVERDGRPSTVLLADVAPGTALHETTSGECYLRVGDSTTRLGAAQREELAYDRGSAQFESRPVTGVEITDLEPKRIDELRRAIDTTNSVDKLLRARSLLTARGEVTIAGYLLLAPHPGEQMPHAHVRVLRYLEPHAGTGARQTVADEGDIRLEGPIPQVIDAAARVIEASIPRRRALQSTGRFGPVPIVPRDAWLEGLVNAVVHRSYSMAGDHIRVEIFPDRVQIESPGRFPGLVDPSHPLDIARYARNPRIARVCNDLGITQEKGEGIRRIFEEMRALGLTDPSYHQTSGSVRLTLFGTTRIAADVAARLPAGSEAAMRTLRASAIPLGTGEISTAIGLARPATLRALRALQELGEIEWSGKSSKDPRATWSLPSTHPTRDAL